MKFKNIVTGILAALAVACVPPKPVPPTPTVQQIIVNLNPGTPNCSIHLESTDAAHPYTADWTQPGNPYSPANFDSVPWAVTTVQASQTCGDTWLPSNSGSVGTAGDGHTSITLPMVAAIKPLPPVPSRDTLANIHACFQGVFATSSDLGTVPSWGPDSWMHPKTEDRLATYNAHKQAGCLFITEALGNGGYQEPGVAYPNNKASGNWFDEKDYASLCTATEEIIRNGQFPLIAIGGDNDGPTFDWVYQQFPANFKALQTCKTGDLTPYIDWLLGFDSVDGLATDEGKNIDDLILFVRGVIGPKAVLVKENQSGWAFWSGAGGGGAGAYNSPAGQQVDVVLQEFDAPPGPPQPAPAVDHGQWDVEHQSYAAVFVDQARGSSFQRIWQVAARTVHNWVNPLDEPLDVVVPCTGGGPSDGQPCHVGADSARPPCYTCVDTPRGRRYVIAFEYFTYLWVRNQVTVADVIGAGKYLTNAGYDQSAGPTTSTTEPSSFTVYIDQPRRPAFSAQDVYMTQQNKMLRERPIPVVERKCK